MYYVPDGDGNYEKALFVRYGMWLEDDVGKSAGPALVRRIAVDESNGDSKGSNLDITSVNRATYTGDAQGLAARGDGTPENTATGQFEASVSLIATFGQSPSLTGSVEGFKPVDPDLDGEAVDENWEVLFNPTPLLDKDGAVMTDNKIAIDWIATGFGDEGERPEGFYGDFAHTFKDDDDNDTGRVAGVYVAD